MLLQREQILTRARPIGSVSRKNCVRPVYSRTSRRFATTTATIGLLIGGVCAAPFGAWMAKKVNPDLLLTFVGIILTLTSGFGLYRALI